MTTRRSLDDLTAAARELEALEAAVDEKRARLRELVVEQVAAGVPIAEVSRVSGVSRVSIYRWVDGQSTEAGPV